MSLELQAMLALIESDTGLRLNSLQTTDLSLTLQKLAASQQISAGDLVRAFQERRNAILNKKMEK